MQKKSESGLGVIVIIVGMAVVIAIGINLYNIRKQPTNNIFSDAKDDSRSTKTYCDSVRKVCFKYPESWRTEKSSTEGTPEPDAPGFVAFHPSGSINIAYLPNVPTAPQPTCGTGKCLFTTFSINSHIGFADTLIVEGVFQNLDIPISIPQYFIMAKNEFERLGLKQSLAIDVAQSPSLFFYNSKQKNPIPLQLALIVQPFEGTNSLQKAKEWLKTSEAIAGKQIVDSAYSQ